MVHQLKGDGTAKSIIIGLIGPIFFALSGLIIGASIIFPTSILIRDFRNGTGDKVQLSVILFTWIAPIIDLCVAFIPELVTFYPILAILLMAVVVSNVTVFLLYRPPMSNREWGFIGAVLILVIINSLVLLFGPTILTPYN